MNQGWLNIAAWATIGGKRHYFKSRLERVYAAYLEILKMGGEVKDWQYEPRRFRFYGADIPKGMKGKQVGSRVYTPDFMTIEKDGSVVWHECKGHLDNRDFAKLRAFSVYYPGEKLVYIIRTMPKGLTARSRAKRSRICDVEKMGFRILVLDEFMRKHAGWVGRIIGEKV